ncbi:unnamed protein product [Cyclocybe aegerita]|uniref:Uncharacterized protein n=1 Tax=Cyclocybe aegerita TaxID=1973307 RepID=A0A8S0W917_CYCAE|nr:unnamed protein product [Cyclocybe aegerita]
MPQEDLQLSNFLSLQFSYLRSLTIDACPIHKKEEAMSFWTRHPTLETIAIFTREKYTRWFVDPLPQVFLPNLRHFKAHFREVRALAQILPQLRSLAVCNSINAQVPYLLRSIVDGGLPKLKSLYIRQTASSSTRNVNIEGALWYEAQDGTFHDGREGSIKRQGQASKRDFLKEYVHSIVRGVPNIEELCFISLPSLTDLIGMSSDFSGLKNLKRMYIEVAAAYEDEVRDKILANASLVLAQQSGLASLESVTNFTPEFPFSVAKIQRDRDGYPDEVVMDRGGGMEIGNEDVAFLYADPDMRCCVE